MTLIVRKDNTSTWTSQYKGALKKALESVGKAAESNAKGNCPVDTGRLRGSITHQVSGDAVYIGTNVEYGKYVEMGTYKQAAQPFLKPAAQDHAAEYSAIFKSALE